MPDQNKGHHQCTFCQRRFAKLEHRERHERQHTGEKPFRCNVCHKVYARKDVLVRHLRNHSLTRGDSPRDFGSPRPHDGLAPSPENSRSVTDHVQTGEAESESRPYADVPSGNGSDHLDGRLRPVPDFAASSMIGDGPIDGNLHTPNFASMSHIDPANLGAPMAFTMPDMPVEWEFQTAPMECLDFTDLYLLQDVTVVGNRNVWQQDSASPLSTVDPIQVQRAWPRKRVTAVVRMVRKLWHHAVDHPCANFFSNPRYAINTSARTQGASPWSIDEGCRARLLKFHSTILPPEETYESQLSVPGTPCASHSSRQRRRAEESSTGLSKTSFPSLEALDLSLDAFFQRVHPVLPFLHVATFTATQTDSPLLLAMCMLGLDVLDRHGSADLIHMTLGRLLRYCRLDLTYNALGKGGASKLITSLATSLLVLYSGLHGDNPIDEHQAHMLTIQAIFIADRHGLFCAQETTSPEVVLSHCDGSQEQRWAAWARVESLKRLILCLVSIDSAYTRMLDLAANISLDNLTVVLLCHSSLFAAPSAEDFYNQVRMDLPLHMPQIDMSRGLECYLTHSRDYYSLRAALDVLALKEAAYRHKLLSALHPDALSEVSFIPAAIYTTDDQASTITDCLFLISSQQMDTLREEPRAALLWNYLCLALHTDLDRVRLACGRKGVEASRLALENLSAWSRTDSARRSLLHAAEIFSILSHHRVTDDKMLLPELMASDAAMTLAVYALLQLPALTPPCAMKLELVQYIDWKSVGIRGLRAKCTPPLEHGMLPHNTISSSVSGVTSFITTGGQPSFGGILLDSSGHNTTRVLSRFTQLLDEIGTLHNPEYPELLRVVGQFLRTL